MDEDMSHLTADDSRLSDTNSLMVLIKFLFLSKINFHSYNDYI